MYGTKCMLGWLPIGYLPLNAALMATLEMNISSVATLAMAESELRVLSGYGKPFTNQRYGEQVLRLRNDDIALTCAAKTTRGRTCLALPHTVLVAGKTVILKDRQM